MGNLELTDKRGGRRLWQTRKNKKEGAASIGERGDIQKEVKHLGKRLDLLKPFLPKVTKGHHVQEATPRSRYTATTFIPQTPCVNCSKISSVYVDAFLSFLFMHFIINFFLVIHFIIISFVSYLVIESSLSFPLFYCHFICLLFGNWIIAFWLVVVSEFVLLWINFIHRIWAYLMDHDSIIMLYVCFDNFV